MIMLSEMGGQSAQLTQSRANWKTNAGATELRLFFYKFARDLKKHYGRMCNNLFNSSFLESLRASRRINSIFEIVRSMVVQDTLSNLVFAFDCGALS